MNSERSFRCAQNADLILIHTNVSSFEQIYIQTRHDCVEDGQCEGFGGQ